MSATLIADIGDRADRTELSVRLAALDQITQIGAARIGPDGFREELVADAALQVVESLPRPKRRDPDLVEVAVERGVRAAVNTVWGKKPTCHVIVLVV